MPTIYTLICSSIDVYGVPIINFRAFLLNSLLIVRARSLSSGNSLQGKKDKRRGVSFYMQKVKNAGQAKKASSFRADSVNSSNFCKSSNLRRNSA